MRVSPTLLPASLIALATSFAFGISALAKPEAKPPSRTTLEVAVKGLRNGNGRVAVALFKNPKAFPDQKQALRGKIVGIAGKRARVRFEKLEPGHYALAVLHDENGNDEMDFNLLGMPLEGYGFSNDASAMFGPPSFEAARFSVGEDTARHTVNVRYFSL